MRRYQDFGELNRVPIARLFNPLDNFDRVNPYLWIFLFSFIALILGTYWPFLSLFAWIGGFIFVLMLAVAVALFSNS